MHLKLILLTIIFIGCDNQKLKVETINGTSTLSFKNELVHKTALPILAPTLIFDDSHYTAITWQEDDQVKLIDKFAIRPAKNQNFIVKESPAGPLLKSTSLTFSNAESLLHIVAFKTQIIAPYRKNLQSMGIKILEFMPESSLVVYGAQDHLDAIEDLGFVETVTSFRNEYKLSADIDFAVLPETQPYPLYSIAFYSDLPTSEEFVNIIGSKMNPRAQQGITNARLNKKQIQSIIALPEVRWVEPYVEPSYDMDNARIQGGANYIESQSPNSDVPGYTGVGINGHVLEGIYPNHPDFAGNAFREPPIGISNKKPSSHGHATFGIIFGSGEGSPAARGMLPNAQGFYTNTSYVNRYKYDPNNPRAERGSRYELTERLIQEGEIMFQTASWGNGRTLKYGLQSAELDRLILELDIPITQSQSNAGNQQSRPQAWAKNIISVGGIKHQNTADTSDDFWGKSGSIGPAADGRIKPDLCAYYDKTRTTSTSGYRDFGGTSGATPIVAGHVGLTIEMWTNGIFNNELSYPVAQRFNNRPHASTVKALLINTASQYKFEGLNHDLTRSHQGWGFPDLKTLYDTSNKMTDTLLVVNEADILENLEEKSYIYTVKPYQKKLQITLVFNDPPASLSAKIHRINNLDLKVISPNGTLYWGNNGLMEGNFSTPNGEHNVVDTVENVIIEAPVAGEWEVVIIADEVNADNHLETETVDIDYALVLSTVDAKAGK